MQNAIDLIKIVAATFAILAVIYWMARFYDQWVEKWWPSKK